MSYFIRLFQLNPYYYRQFVFTRNGADRREDFVACRSAFKEAMTLLWTPFYTIVGFSFPEGFGIFYLLYEGQELLGVLVGGLSVSQICVPVWRRGQNFSGTRTREFGGSKFMGNVLKKAFTDRRVRVWRRSREQNLYKSTRLTLCKST